MKFNMFGINKSSNKQTVTSYKANEFFERIKTDSYDSHIPRYREIYAQMTVSYGRYVHPDDIKYVCVSAEYY